MISTISTLPAVPNRNDPTTFSEKADALLGSMPTLVTELNNFVTEVNTLSFKSACKCATTTAITLSGAQTIDGQNVVSGDRVLVKNQGTASQNGIYTASNSTWTRATDLDTPAEVAGSFVPITFGVVNGGKIFYTTFNATGGTIGTTAIPWNSLTEATITGVGVIAAANGGTGLASYGVGDLIYSTAATTLTNLPAAAAGNVLKSGTAPSWGKVALASDVSGTLPVASGGTGQATLSANSVILGNGTSGVQTVAPGTVNNVLISNGTTFVSSTLPQAVPAEYYGPGSSAVFGAVNIASTAELQTGTDTIKAVTPSVFRAGALVRGTAQNTTSGTSIDFAPPSAGIPSWAKRITIMFSGVSTNGTSTILVQIGDNGGIETTGYESEVWYDNAAGAFSTSTNGFIIDTANAASFNTARRFGTMQIVNVSGNTWVSASNIFAAVHNTVNSGAGGKSLSGTLDRVRITTSNGTDTFDAGSINIMYE